MSLLMWECGLKHGIRGPQVILGVVTPYVGVWIETSSVTPLRVHDVVTPYVGVWIETLTLKHTRERT